MKSTNEFFDLHDLAQGNPRELAQGINARIFLGDQAMLSVVRMDPNTEVNLHSHDEEQWGLLLEGEVIHIQEGQETPLKAGAFWRTPGGVPHGIRTGAVGALVLDIFSPPREDYTRPGSGYGN